ncbi:retinaldehyde-binding protein 1-like [Chironomus tepperi]|uniref:retinaldehyde-binding protein 1-like n=1 Tax=Chironomus tepperi TaxID=113505 RepID=UPI00391F16A9
MSDKILVNDPRGEKLLKVFKNWLEKHPYIKYEGEDSIDDLLMYFLRSKKYKIDSVLESFEFAAKFIKSRPQFYENPGPHDYEFTTKDDSPVIFMNKRDSQGRRVYIYRIKHFQSFKDVKFFRNVFLTPFFMSFMVETQINGIVIIADFRGINMNKARKVPIKTIIDAAKVTKIAGSRLKQINLVGMPAFFRPLYEIAKTFTSSKVISRINFLSSMDELSTVMDVSLLPEDFGGTATDLLDFSEFEQGVKFVHQINKLNVNLSKMKKFEGIKDIKELEID